MKKTHWLRNMLIILLVCALAGGILSVIQFRRENNRTYVSTVLTFSFDGAQDGKAPNGYAFSPAELASETVVAEALAAAGLTDKYETEEIQRNLFVQGNYPENLLERLGSYDSVIGENAATNVALLTKNQCRSATTSLMSMSTPTWPTSASSSSQPSIYGSQAVHSHLSLYG